MGEGAKYWARDANRSFNASGDVRSEEGVMVFLFMLLPPFKVGGGRALNAMFERSVQWVLSMLSNALGQKVYFVMNMSHSGFLCLVWFPASIAPNSV